MPVDLRIDTEEIRTEDYRVSARNRVHGRELFGRRRPAESRSTPTILILKVSTSLRARAGPLRAARISPNKAVLRCGDAVPSGAGDSTDGTGKFPHG